MKFEIVGEIANVETIAQGNGIRDLSLLRKQHGLGNWRKKKGTAHVKLPVKSKICCKFPSARTMTNGF